MVGVAENLNVRVTLTLEKKWCVGGNDFPLSDYRTTIAQLSSDFSTLPWELYFDRYCICIYYKYSTLPHGISINIAHKVEIFPEAEGRGKYLLPRVQYYRYSTRKG